MSEQERISQLLGVRLRKARVMKNETQETLAVRAGVSRQLIGRMERGDAAVALDTWLKVSIVLGLLETWGKVLEMALDPFEEFDKKVHEEEVFKKKRVRLKKR